MAEEHHQNWLELCKAAAETNNRDEFLSIIRELNEVLEHEEQKRRSANKPVGKIKSTRELPC
ncbi:MAG: hypothetical protein WBV46_05725 [Terriglobales bacterium]|jgi:hypothetical protein